MNSFNAVFLLIIPRHLQFLLLFSLQTEHNKNLIKVHDNAKIIFALEMELIKWIMQFEICANNIMNLFN